MSWATNYIEQLRKLQVIQFRPRGNSMVPLIKSGQLVTLKPVLFKEDIIEGSVVLCKVEGKQYLHLVKAISHGRYQIGNNKGHINGWTPFHNIFGIVTAIED